MNRYFATIFLSLALSPFAILRKGDDFRTSDDVQIVNSSVVRKQLQAMKQKAYAYFKEIGNGEYFCDLSDNHYVKVVIGKHEQEFEMNGERKKITANEHFEMKPVENGTPHRDFVICEVSSGIITKIEEGKKKKAEAGAEERKKQAEEMQKKQIEEEEKRKAEAKKKEQEMQKKQIEEEEKQKAEAKEREQESQRKQAEERRKIDTRNDKRTEFNKHCLPDSSLWKDSGGMTCQYYRDNSWECWEYNKKSLRREGFRNPCCACEHLIDDIDETKDFPHFIQLKYELMQKADEKAQLKLKEAEKRSKQREEEQKQLKLKEEEKRSKELLQEELLEKEEFLNQLSEKQEELLKTQEELQREEEKLKEEEEGDKPKRSSNAAILNIFVLLAAVFVLF